MRAGWRSTSQNHTKSRFKWVEGATYCKEFRPKNVMKIFPQAQNLRFFGGDNNHSKSPYNPYICIQSLIPSLYPIGSSRTVGQVSNVKQTLIPVYWFVHDGILKFRHKYPVDTWVGNGHPLYMANDQGCGLSENCFVYFWPKLQLDVNFPSRFRQRHGMGLRPAIRLRRPRKGLSEWPASTLEACRGFKLFSAA